ncbi:mitochondrial-processing peptidase subunit alpha-like [Dorcoceras hygrometricum]|uniref:Mitochondrial-processing peptidase subunit alpha-like n=1 Tax=Dorcoceras hygrometricum TaxID=472368 RepID=A0A2Z7CLH3_9LAMI|nr:mitochondrial-processing peptidase subunit alpha-like [Dorcoceras hygrometricum]
MGSNPSTESNYKTAVNNKNKMQMLCMRPGTTAEGYNQGREPKNSMHSSTESAKNSGHGVCSKCGNEPVNNKNKMQMLCMRPGTTAEGYNQGREPKNSMHSSTESAKNSGHGVCSKCGNEPLALTPHPNTRCIKQLDLPLPNL